MDNLTNLSYDAFQPINSGTFTINVKKANTDTVLASLNPAEFMPSTVYTIYLNGTSSNLAVNVLEATY
jgi:hydrogenase maturation factor